MTTYYVRKSGNDTTGDGSTGTPWLTLVKAQATIPTTGCTVKVGGGIFQESYTGLGYWYLNRTMSGLTTYEAEDPNDKPVIQPGGTPIYLVRCGATFTNYVFRNLVFDSNGVTQITNLFNLSTATNVADITFVGCEFRWIVDNLYAIGAPMTGATKTLDRLLVEDCLFTQVGADAGGDMYGMRLTLSTGLRIADVTIRNCRATMDGKPLWIDGVTNFLVEGCTFHSNLSYGLLIGADGGATTGTNSGTVQNCSISSGAGHAVLVGWGCDGVTVSHCTIAGGNQGIVVKECTNATITYNLISGGTDSSLYFKAATNSSASYNTVRNTAGILGRVGYNLVGGHKCQNISMTHNTFYGLGSSKLLYWGGDTEDLGGGVCDYNTYDPKGSGKFGVCRGDNDVQTMTELLAAWSGYGDGSNDSHSTLFEEESDFIVLLGRH